MKGREERAKQFVETSGSAIMTEEDILEDDLLYDRVGTHIKYTMDWPCLFKCACRATNNTPQEVDVLKITLVKCSVS